MISGFASGLLALLFAFVQGHLKCRINGSGGGGLHIRHTVRISVERNGDARVAQPFLGNLWMNAGPEHPIAGASNPHPELCAYKGRSDMAD